MRPHVKDHPPALRAFQNQIECGNGPRNAAMAAVGAGAWVSPEWLRANYCPMHASIAALELCGDPRGAIVFKQDHLSEYQQELAAIQFCEAKRGWAESTSLSDDERRALEAREDARQKERAAFVAVRALSLFEQWLESKREAFRAEAAGEFDALHPPIETKPAPRVLAAVPSIAPTKTNVRKTTNTPPTPAA